MAIETSSMHPNVKPATDVTDADADIQIPSINTEEFNQGNKLPWRGISTVIGCIMIHLTLGSFYTWGNLTTYATSYIRNCSYPHDLTYDSTFWVTPTIGGCQGFSMYFGGVVARKVGDRFAIFLGCLIMSLANVVSYWTIQSSFASFIVTYGVLQGLGVGAAYAQPLSICCRWFPEHKGLINGLIVAGFGGGGAIFNLVITNYINPTNLEPKVIVEGKKYFGENAIFDRVPSFFYVIGSIFCAIQLIGLCLMFEPNKEAKIKKPNLLTRIISSMRKHETRRESRYQSIDSTTEQVVGLDWKRRSSSRHIEVEEIEIEDNADSGPIPVEQRSLAPSETLKSWKFWILYLVFTCNGFGISFNAGLWKVYGQSCSYDDRFLAVTGSLSSVANGLGRIFWGTIADKFSYKVAMACVTCLMMALMLSFNASEEVGPGLYMVYVIGIFLSFSGTFSLMPTACVKTFGVKSMPENYGLLFSSTVPQNLLSVLVAKQLGKLEWYGQFWIVAAFFLASFILTLFYPTQTEEGNKI